MKDIELLQLAVNSLRYRNLRSWLAILGVVIGVASIISLISISTGLNASIQAQLSGLGANIITITPGGGQASRNFFGGGGSPGAGGGNERTTHPLTFKEADSLRHLPGVQLIDARLSSRATVNYRNKNSSISVVGTEPAAFLTSTNANLYEGHTLSGDSPQAVLGFSVMNTTFKEDMLNKPIKINGQPFRVVGILNASGASFGGSDNSIFIPQKMAQTLFSQRENATSIVAVAAAGTNPDDVAGNISAKLLQLHRVTAAKQDFSVVTASSLQATASAVTGTLGIFLGVIASISLLVGGIGVMNAMFTSVLEQTKYIGILKALGARRIEIIKLFFFEACLVGLVGGALGVLISFGVSIALSSFGVPTKITPDLVLLGMGFSVIVGAVSGALPARNAASVAPVEALRYE